jgi:hypothetical protein
VPTVVVAGQVLVNPSELEARWSPAGTPSWCAEPTRPAKPPCSWHGTLEGEFLDTVIGIPDSRTGIVMLQLPDGARGWSSQASPGQTTCPVRRPPPPTSWDCATVRGPEGIIVSLAERIG